MNHQLFGKLSYTLLLAAGFVVVTDSLPSDYLHYQSSAAYLCHLPQSVVAASEGEG